MGRAKEQFSADTRICESGEYFRSPNAEGGAGAWVRDGAGGLSTSNYSPRNRRCRLTSRQMLSFKLSSCFCAAWVSSIAT